MREHLKVALDSSGLPAAMVPFSCMWELVEYLSYQRVTVSYQYHASHFTVTFTRSDVESAQQVLDGWNSVTSRELQLA